MVSRVDRVRTSYVAIVTLVIVLTALAARFRTFGNPVVGFDEQFYLLVGDRMLKGALPYVDLFDRKPIGLFLIYAGSRLLGGDGFLQYKLVALAFVVATALLIAVEGRRLGGRTGPLLGALLYVLWLNFTEGEGGQAPVFYNLPMLAAAMVVSDLWRRGQLSVDHITRRGIGAMTLIGLALQIKYTAVVEGVFFGSGLTVLAWVAGMRRLRLAITMAAWISAALLPTLLALMFYVAIGHGHEFVFANFLSAFGQAQASLADRISGAALIAVILSPLVVLAVAAMRRSANGPTGKIAHFHLSWLAASALSIVLYGRFASPHYAMPLLPPLCVLIGAAADRRRRVRNAAVITCVTAFAVGQAVLVATEYSKGGASVAAAVAAAANPLKGCMYVYDGPPALYMLTGSCIPTRWAFPGHLNTREEDDRRALGVDPVAEIRRIMGSRPAAVIDDWPRFVGGNDRTRAVLSTFLERDYCLVAAVPTAGLFRDI